MPETTVKELREALSKIFQAFMQPMQSDDISELAGALCSFQYELEGAKKDSNNPFFKSRYADLESCLDALKEPLHNHGLSVVQTGRISEAGPVLVTTLLHRSGQWIKGELAIVCTKQNDPQAQGSALTYARRYGLCAITGLVQVDDDGEAAKGKPENQKATSSSAQKGNASSSASTATNQKQSANGKDAGKAEGKSAAMQESGKADTSAKQENVSTASSNGGSTAGANGSKSADTAAATQNVSANKVGAEQMGQLMKAGMANGWNKTNLSEFLYSAFNLTPETITQITWAQWETAVKLVGRPENSGGKVTHSVEGKPLAPEFCFPKGGK
ncbi:MAG: ERF family protein [Candidatus Obscuribacterales bacterium]|nr:ERF family protein [Candidatus Obscuribacterales bacterium]